MTRIERFVLIIGAMKVGTRLFVYLGTHPQIAPCQVETLQRKVGA